MIKQVAIVGTGTMGAGITQTISEHGYNVHLIGRSQKSVNACIKKIQERLERKAKKKKLTEKQCKQCLGRITASATLHNALNADLVIEAIVENLKVKQNTFRQLDEITKKNTVLASNTSGLSLTQIAKSCKNPKRVIGLHFFNPAPVMKLVEVVQAKQTSRTTVKKSLDFVKSLNKTPVQVKDSPGFVSNRLLMPMINEAIITLDKGIASKEGIDTVMKLGMRHPMGPLELADFIGLDVCLDIMNGLHKGLKSDKYKPASLLKKMVKQGNLGRKTKQGFYKYK